MESFLEGINSGPDAPQTAPWRQQLMAKVSSEGDRGHGVGAGGTAGGGGRRDIMHPREPCLLFANR